MKKRKYMPLVLLMAAVLAFFSVSCSGQDYHTDICRKTGTWMTEDGWAYVFTYHSMKDESKCSDRLIRYEFIGLNLRYQYSDQYFNRETRKTSSGSFIETYEPGVLMWGSASEAQKHDRAIINSLLVNSNTVEDLLAIDPNSIEFEDLDKDIFFATMHQALEGDWHKEHDRLKYLEKPVWAMFSEPVYHNGYRFQVAFVQEMGVLDHIFLDLLYQTGNGVKDYIQLSDLAERGEATEEQKQLYAFLKSLEKKILESEYFNADVDAYRENRIAGVELKYLADMLENIHNNNYAEYVSRQVIH